MEFENILSMKAPADTVVHKDHIIPLYPPTTHLSPLALFSFLRNHSSFDFEFCHLYFLLLETILQKCYGKGDNKFQVVIYLSRLPDKMFLSFGSVNVI